MTKKGKNPRENWLLDRAKGKRILNLGYVGKGQPGHNLNQHIQQQNPQATLIPLDLNAAQVIQLQTNNAVVGNIFNLPIHTDSVDSVVLGEVIEHFYEIDSLLAEISRVMKQDGQLVITTPNTYEFFRVLKHWFLKGSDDVYNFKNARSYLADSDHKIFWEPLSLVNLLAHHKLKVTELTTLSFTVPYVPFARELDWQFWPFNRVSEYLCLVAQKQS